MAASRRERVGCLVRGLVLVVALAVLARTQSARGSSPPLRASGDVTLRAGADGRARLTIHAGNDWSSPSSTQTGETVAYGVLADGDVWVISDGEVRVIDTDAAVDAADGAAGEATRRGASPSECADSSFMDGGGVVYLTHDRSFRCSCLWTEEAPCPSYLRVARGDELVAEVFAAGNTDVALADVDAVRAGAAVARASFDPAYPGADAARKACTPLENADRVAGRYWCG